ncbi:uncharacterized protein si:dkeyp-97a10.3 isoform X1 [Nothobranchius furzeri]|uniref:Transcript variant X1 n=3 Tax=Nothobranchius TaxID=28779 RepID=A0A8C6LZN1_NOTFU|nr:transcript variant X1 [Nothobranchius furzeri]
MKLPELFISLSLAALLSASVLAQNLVPIQIQPDPAQIQTGTNIVLTVATTSNVLSITWMYQGSTALAVWTSAGPVVNPVAQFQGRVSVTATQLQIGSAQLQDAGNYTVVVVPSAATGMTSNSKSVQLSVFNAVVGVSLSVTAVAMEGKNVSLNCTWTAGTNVAVQWSKDGVTLSATSRITISGGSVVISPSVRGDTGDYTCTASNPVSAQTATKPLTVYYGPDTPAMSITRPKQCVGGGDVLVGQTLRISCTSVSLPSAVFSWRENGQPVSGQPDSGAFSLQTVSKSDAGWYTCTASNSITGGTSTQSANVSVVDVCFDGGEVAGIVIGSFLGLLIIVLLIVLLICLVQRRKALQRRRDAAFVQKTDPNQRPVPPDPQTNNGRDLNQALQPPLYNANAQTRRPDHLITTQRESRGNPQTLALNGLQNSDTNRNNGHANRLPHNAVRNINSHPDNGIDNPAFTRSEDQNATQQLHPNILIQTGGGGGQGSNRAPAVQVSLNPSNNAPVPTINVNLNSYPANGQQALQDHSFPSVNQANINASSMQNNLLNTRRSNLAMQSSQFDLDGPLSPDRQNRRALIPTGFTHFNSYNSSQQNVNPQIHQQVAEPPRRSDRSSGGHNAASRSMLRQMPWDTLRGTPAYPSGTPQGAQTSHEDDYTDYTIHPPIREGRTTNRAPPQSQTAPRRTTPTRRDPPSQNNESWSRSTDRQRPNAASVPQHERSHHTQRSPRTQRESAQQEITGGQTSSRQETTRRNNPQALPLMSQQASAGHSAVSQGPAIPQGLGAALSTDTRALADPNHLQQAHMAAPVQTLQGQGTHTQSVMPGASQPRQGGTAPAPKFSAQPNHSNLTRAALQAHTETAQVFQNRRQQTQAALLHPSTIQNPPPPPPVIPLAQFQNLPKERSHHKSPKRGPQPVMHHIPATRQHHRPSAPHHTTMVPTHHHPSAHGHGHPAHFAHPSQQHAHRGRPR